MTSLVMVGVAFTVVGLGLLVWCIIGVAKARSENLGEDEMRARVQRAVVWNLAAMAISGIGLTVLIVGLIL